jgi:Protein of unknown function (DUF4230)
MSSTEVQPPPVKTRSPWEWLLAALAGMVLAVLLVGAGFWAIGGFSLLELGRMLRGGEVRMKVDQPTVIRQIRGLDRLETVSYTMEKIIGGERENPVLPNFLAGDRLLLIVHGEVIAGVDLSKLQPSDVVVNGHSVSIHLPAAEIFTVPIDNEKSKVYSRETGLFSTPDPNLETEVRQEGERQLRDAALQDGVLDSSNKNARQILTSLLNGLGFDNVEYR